VEVVGSLPRDGERGDRAGTGAADAVAIGIARDVVILASAGISSSAITRAYLSWREFLLAGRFVERSPQSMVSAPAARRPAGIDEDRDHRRDFAAIDKVVEDIRRPDDAVDAVHIFERLSI
jgi:hypothetical protein